MKERQSFEKKTCEEEAFLLALPLFNMTGLEKVACAWAGLR
jgi:hypothetical protein